MVDALGGIHVPAVTDATDPEFAEAVLTAIRQWHFPGSRVNGQPVQVIVTRVFSFGSDPPAE